ncbi:MAG: methylamine utilization protein MauE [Chromatiales bacterium]|jgi:uncharacterized membrane protein YphA (DoxX/SURF4 family)|nr:methylamine utilization protein MauE [Chromatiales bacterium]MDP6151362.1 MauE/DoxX family redox-associated membrane protein [Gammaproteobacteria bacterium]MDP7093789.1 MauE/DoxX family redox-associated membrane protein [Gammaproteobacteria bacterium]MDP7271402.1 MauE/DoxX family redox-associated membrane protein [Gammaproteobacteria bacterium]HJP03937.1 MauE/DoxX family redox-associated membrane protein [Gammaproteobacteria bacterium]
MPDLFSNLLTIDPAVAMTCRLLLVLVFASAVCHKLAEPVSFRAVVGDYRLLPNSLVTVAAAGLVALECTTAITLLIPATAAFGAWIAFGLLLAYTFAITINLARGRTHIDCGCVGPARAPDTRGRKLSCWLLVRNLPLVLIALTATLPVDQRSLLVWDFATIFFAVMSLGMLYTTVNHLLTNAPVLRALVTRHD